MQIQDNINNVNAGFFVRLAAYIIDAILVGIALMFLRLPMWIVSIFSPYNPLTSPILFRFSIWDIFLYLLSVLYFVTFTYFTGQTLGKRLMNIKVASGTDEKLTLWNVVYRETIGRYLSSLMCLGYLLIAVDHKKRGLHDILCDTKVIYSNVVILIDNDSDNKMDMSSSPIIKEDINKENMAPNSEENNITTVV